MSTPREILQIAGCQLWLDGADTGSMTFSGSEVRQWRDKSGNSRHATPSGTGPTYTQNVFNGRAAPLFGNTPMLTPSFVLSATNRITLFAVFLQTGPNGRGNSEIIYSPVSYLYFDLYVRTSNVGELIFVVNGISYFLTVTDISQLNTMTSHVSDGSTYTGFLNGTQAVTGSLGTINYSLNTSSTLSITTANYIGPLCEILFYNTNLSTTTRQFIEGYLAWKWGTQTSLPLAHPYKTAAPFLTTWSPLVTIPRGLSLIPVNTLSTIKTLTLPVVSTNPGLLLILKDHLGYASTNPISLSTVGLDRIERNNISSMVLSNSFGAWTFQNDGRTNWFLLNVYTNNLYRAPPPVSGIPLTISGIQAWFDGSDSSTVVLSGTTVTQWRDKSGLGNHTNARGGTTTYVQSAINGLPALSFAKSWFTGPFASTYVGNQVRSLAVASLTTNADAYARIFSLARPGAFDYNSADTMLFFCRNTAQNIMIYRNGIFLSLNLPAYSTLFLVQSGHDGATQSIGLNGTLTPTSQNSGITTNLNISSYGIGANANTSDVQYWDGYIAEIIYYTSTLTTAQIQLLEGYLAWKWGIQGNLPTGHPYKNAAP